MYLLILCVLQSLALIMFIVSGLMTQCTQLRQIFIRCILALLYMISFIRVHLWSLYKKCTSRFLYDCVLNEDISINLVDIWCVHFDMKDKFFYHHKVKIYDAHACNDAKFIVIDYQIIDDTNSDKIHTYYLDPIHPFETCSVDELAMTPIPVQFKEFRITSKHNNVECLEFNITSQINKALGPLNDFHSDLLSTSRSPEIIQYMMWCADQTLFENWIEDEVKLKYIVTDGSDVINGEIDVNISDTNMLHILCIEVHDAFEEE